MVGPEWRASPHIDQTLFVPESQHPIVDKVYQSCFGTPPLYILDGFREDGNTCMRQYSYPQFFMEQWKSVMMREQEERRKKKNEKKIVVRHSPLLIIM